MSWISLLCGQCAMLILVAGSVRGNRVFWHNRLMDGQRLILKSCATIGLLLSFALQVSSDDPPALTIIEWVLLLGPETMIAALACSLWERKPRS